MIRVLLLSLFLGSGCANFAEGWMKDRGSDLTDVAHVGWGDGGGVLLGAGPLNFGLWDAELGVYEVVGKTTIIGFGGSEYRGTSGWAFLLGNRDEGGRSRQKKYGQDELAAWGHIGIFLGLGKGPSADLDVVEAFDLLAGFVGWDPLTDDTEKLQELAKPVNPAVEPARPSRQDAGAASTAGGTPAIQ